MISRVSGEGQNTIIGSFRKRLLVTLANWGAGKEKGEKEKKSEEKKKRIVMLLNPFHPPIP